MNHPIFPKAKKTLYRLEDLHNQASDTDFVWFPFIFLRPKPSEKISTRKIGLMAVLFGLYFGLVWALKNKLMGRELSIESISKTVAFAVLAFYFWFHLVTRNLWNRRAERLTRVNLP